MILVSGSEQTIGSRGNGEISHDRGDVKLVGLAPSMRLAVLARKLICQGCKGRQVRVSLGTYLIT